MKLHGEYLKHSIMGDEEQIKAFEEIIRESAKERKRSFWNGAGIGVILTATMFLGLYVFGIIG